MKTAGDILSNLFDERFITKARGYSKLFNSWNDITAKNGIAAAADHSRIKDLDRGILLVEMDHPGWKQILQTKQSKLLNDFRIRFPELNISGISLMLGRGENLTEEKPNVSGEDYNQTEPDKDSDIPVITETRNEETGIDSIKDDEFKEMLIKLGQKINENEYKKSSKKTT